MKEKIELAEAEIARLENIIKIQQKQIERLLAERDALRRYVPNWPRKVTEELCCIVSCGKPATWQDAINSQPVAGRKYCHEHALQYTTYLTVLPYYGKLESIIAEQRLEKHAKAIDGVSRV